MGSGHDLAFALFNDSDTVQCNTMQLCQQHSIKYKSDNVCVICYKQGVRHILLIYGGHSYVQWGCVNIVRM